MNDKKSESRINLEKLAGGAFTEKLNEALLQVAENIQNPNTEAAAKREITVKIKFAPNKTRQLVNTTIAVTTKLAATEAIDTQMLMGKDIKTGRLEIAEYNGQISGQTSLFGREDDEDDSGADWEEGSTFTASGRPLDLRHRNRQPKEQTLIPGRDFDPESGELYETAGQSADDRRPTGSLLTIEPKSAQS